MFMKKKKKPIKRKSMRRKVADAVDGDTVKMHSKLGNSQYVRLPGYDAPEKGQPGYGKAKKALSKLVKGKTLTVREISKGPYGRTIGDLYVNRTKVSTLMKSSQNKKTLKKKRR